MTLAEIHNRFSPGCDKATVHSYLEVYAELLAPYRKIPNATILEVGIFKGDSLRMWELYFELGHVHGVDLCDTPLQLADIRPMIAEGMHNIHLFDAASPNQAAEHFKDMKFDVIIEDASHAVSQQVAIFKNLRPRLAEGGLYVIEDIQDLDATRATFERLDPTLPMRILDRRGVKGRYDDVLVVFGGR